MTNDPKGSETYIGFGIYASFDGWQVRLRTPRGMEDHEVFLEPGVWASLVEYVKTLDRSDAESVLEETQRSSHADGSNNKAEVEVIGSTAHQRGPE